MCRGSARASQPRRWRPPRWMVLQTRATSRGSLPPMCSSSACGGPAGSFLLDRWWCRAERRAAGARRAYAARPPVGATRRSPTAFLLVSSSVRQMSFCFLSLSPLDFLAGTLLCFCAVALWATSATRAAICACFWL
jgi:hypothetical protein